MVGKIEDTDYLGIFMLEKVEVQSLIKTIDKNNGIKRALEKLSIKSEEDFFKYTIYKAENE